MFVGICDDCHKCFPSIEIEESRSLIEITFDGSVPVNELHGFYTLSFSHFEGVFLLSKLVYTVLAEHIT